MTKDLGSLPLSVNKQGIQKQDIKRNQGSRQSMEKYNMFLFENLFSFFRKGSTRKHEMYLYLPQCLYCSIVLLIRFISWWRNYASFLLYDVTQWQVYGMCMISLICMTRGQRCGTGITLLETEIGKGHQGHDFLYPLPSLYKGEQSIVLYMQVHARTVYTMECSGDRYTCYSCPTDW